MSELLQPDTRAQQAKLAQYCRDGVEPELIGTTDGRLPHYRRLVFNVVTEALSSTYPLAKNLLSEKEWATLVQLFFEEHTCTHPQVWRMPFDLISYVEVHQPNLVHRYPHLPELLKFEWLEVEYYMMPDRAWEGSDTQEYWKEAWNLNPESEVVELRYPLHVKNARFISRTDEGNYFCLVFRQPGSFKVRFVNLSAFLAWMLEQQLKGQSLERLFPEISQRFGVSDEVTLKAQIQPFYEKLVEDGMVR